MRSCSLQRPAEESQLTVVLSLDGAGRTVEVATIGFPDDATANDALVPPTIGLAAVLER